MAAPRVAFLFLGETLLIPHLWPIAEALAERAPDIAIDLWVATSIHEEMLERWSRPYPSMRLRRAPGFKKLFDLPPGTNPPLPAKLPMLGRLGPRLFRTKVVVCAEQTSLWLPMTMPFHPARFLKTAHGAGSVSARDDRRRRAATRMLVPGENERSAYLARGFDPDRVIATGYVKSAFRQRTLPRTLFADDKPILLYAPHWQPHRSSWWEWGQQIVAMLAAQDRWNVILAPHQRLFEKDEAARGILQGVAHLSHVHCDWQGFAMVDGSYTAAADLYLGDSSSQVVEYWARPRPTVFLNAPWIDWQQTDDHDFWWGGDVVDSVDAVMPALENAAERHSLYVATQQKFAERALGDLSGNAPMRCAEEVLRLLHG